MSILPQSSVITADHIPTLFGQQDAQAGASCCPEMYFIHHADKVAYCCGYAAVVGHNETTRQFLGELAVEAASVVEVVAASATPPRTTIRSFNDAYKVASHIDEQLQNGEFAIIAGERIEKRNDRLYIPARATTQWVPYEMADFVIWPNRKAWNQAIKTHNAA